MPRCFPWSVGSVGKFPQTKTIACRAMLRCLEAGKRLLRRVEAEFPERCGLPRSGMKAKAAPKQSRAPMQIDGLSDRERAHARSVPTSGAIPQSGRFGNYRSPLAAVDVDNYLKTLGMHTEDARADLVARCKVLHERWHRLFGPIPRAQTIARAARSRPDRRPRMVLRDVNC